MKYLSLILLVGCGLDNKPLGSCVVLPSGFCIDYADTTKAHVLTPDSTRYLCDLYNGVYNSLDCHSGFPNVNPNSCEFPPKDGVKATFRFYEAPTEAVQQFCDQAHGKFTGP